jgi:hypothetical protein
MIESQGILIDSFKSRRRRFIRSAIAQSILQCLTFGAAIVTYHYFATPQLIIEARQDEQAAGWNSAFRLTCPIVIGKAGG